MAGVTDRKAIFSDSDYADIATIIHGMNQWREQNGLESTEADNFLKQFLPSQPEPVTADRLLDINAKILSNNPGGFELDRLTPEQFDEAKQKLIKAGHEDFLDDGVIDNEEFLVMSAELGKGYMASRPDLQIGNEALQSARDLLSANGIDDPDGTMAQGLAANSMRIAERINTGLGLTPEPPSVAPVAPHERLEGRNAVTPHERFEGRNTVAPVMSELAP